MRKRSMFLVLVLVWMVVLSGCASDMAWRKATVTTFELVGTGFETTRTTTEILKANGVISDIQLAKIKDVYNKAVVAYAKAGETLKLAGRVATSAEKETLLNDYATYIAEFTKLSVEVYNMIKDFNKKVSLNEIRGLIMEGGVL